MGWNGAAVLAALALAAAAVSSSADAFQVDDQAPQAGAWTVPDPVEIRRILVERVDVQHQGVGIVVGVIDAHGQRVVTYGAMAKGDPRPLDGDTIFEIGSITKVFTSLLLSDTVQRGQVALDDPISKFLPPGLILPQRAGRQITLVDLATHTSGLPRMPTNFTPKDAGNPYADYTMDQLYKFLGGYTLSRDIGSQYEYSNLGGALLGHVLARRAGVGYETLVKNRITGPLGMRSTAITLTPEMKARLASGYTATLEPAASWDLPAFAGAGALRSSANDLLTFLAAELGYRSTPLAAAMNAQFAVRRPTTIPNTQIALGWHITSNPHGEVVWHNGGTGGYRTFIGFDRAAGLGVVVLTNVSNRVGGDDIGMHLLTGAHLAVLAPPVQHTAIQLDEKALGNLVGRYQLAPQIVVEVTLAQGRLFAQLTGQQKLEIFPESPTRVFWKAVDAQADFTIDSSGHATMMTLHQNGRELPAPAIQPN